jgi:hypothetical protein
MTDPTPAAPVPASHRVKQWGHCHTCGHDRIPGEGCARADCPDAPPAAPQSEDEAAFEAWFEGATFELLGRDWMLAAWQAALTAERAKPKQCLGSTDPDCNYAAICGQPCNKCGRVHRHHMMPARAAEWPAKSAAVLADAGRLDWAEQHPLEFLQCVLGKCPDDSDSLRVYSTLTGKTLPSGALELSSARWNMRAAIDAARHPQTDPAPQHKGT